jgi:serine/threonine-protein kinase
MGEVYRARDRKLQRDVAIKVLPVAVASDAARIERFSHEAKVLASLNHRNIAAIYGFDDEGHAPALVMELVEGPTLADRLVQGALPMRDALRIARQVAEALEAAHAQGIVHRDLKPANIKVPPDGDVKVLDFGLAKALTVNALDSSDAGASTVATGPLTAPGTVVGTGPYMSPEQARGTLVDRRTDLWAYGVVLWEMLTGRQLFKGATLSDSIAAVLNVDPDWDLLPADTPPSIRRLLQRCLQKDRSRRLDSAVVARLDVDDALSGEPIRSAPSASPLPWIAVGVLAFVVIAQLALMFARPQSAEPSTVRVRADLGADLLLRKDLASGVIISPDGRTLVYATEPTTAPSSLYVRHLDQLTATALRGTEHAANPFFSPDGQWVGFFVGRTLKKISVNGGTALTISETPGGRGGGFWTAEDEILFGSMTDQTPLLFRVSASGGPSTPVTTLQPGEITHRWPQVLPGNRGVLYTSNTSANWDDARVVVQPWPSGAPKLVQPGFFGRYVESGHLLFVKGGTLYAAPFDLDRLEVTGAPVTVTDNVVADTTTGSAQFDVSATGTLVFLQGRGYSPARASAWMERGGNTLPLRAEAVDWANPHVSRDGKLLALDISDGKQTDVFVQHFDQDRLTKLTFERADDFKPILTPDGERVVFTSTRDGAANLYWQRVDGAGAVERLGHSANAQAAGSWHPDGRLLAFHETTSPDNADILLLPVDRDGTGWRVGRPRVFAGETVNETEPRFSPDGRWLAYTSNETGRAEIFVRSTDGGGKWQVSSSGGRDAAWSRTRAELLYFDPNQSRVMVAPYVIAGQSFTAAAARPWAVTPVGRPTRPGRTFDLHPDGERVAIVPAEGRDADHVNLVFHVFEHLRASTAK